MDNPAPVSSQPAASAAMMPIGQLLRASFRPYSKHTKVIASLLALPLVAALLIFVPGLSIFSGLAFTILLIVAQVGIILVLHEGARPWGELTRRSWAKFLPLLGLTILAGFMYLGGLTLFILPGIYLAVSFSLATMILVVENIGGFTALLKSREYIRGRWLSVFGRFLLLILLSIIVSVILSIFGVSEVQNSVSPVNSFLSSLSSLIILPFTTAFLFTLYRDLVTIKPLPTFTPSSKSRTWSIILFIFGLLTLPLVFFLAYWIATTVIGDNSSLTNL